MSELQKPDPSKPLTLRAFLETIPPNSDRLIEGVGFVVESSNYPGSPAKNTYVGEFPWIELHCPSTACAGIRRFDPGWKSLGSGLTFVSYTCRNCSSYVKTFALLFFVESADLVRVVREGKGPGEIVSHSKKVYLRKLGEYPEFGPPIPAKVLRLIQSDQELFLQGWRSEKQSFGIGSFAYYRRIVENHKDRLIEEIVKVARALHAPEDEIEKFENSAKEIQFTKAVASIKGALPDELLIKGQNPMLILHQALSIGIHSSDDDECLDLAQTIHAVLVEMAETSSRVLRDKRELEAKVSKLMNSGKTE